MSLAPDGFLQAVLAEQTLEEGSVEREELLAEHERVRSLLVSNLIEATPLIEVGGSMAKETLVRAGFDLDTICYFANDDDGAGDTLREIREAVEAALKTEYVVEPKRSALRISGRKKGTMTFSVDVVPGRFVDDVRDDVFCSRKAATKSD